MQPGYSNSRSSSVGAGAPSANKYASFAANGAGGAAASWNPDNVDINDESQLRGATKEIKRGNVDLSRQALSRLQQAEDIAASNLEKLSMQGEALSNIEHRLDVADAYAEENDAKTSELKRLNRWFFIPAWGGGSKTSKAIKMSKGSRADEKYESEKAARQRQMEMMQARLEAQRVDSVGPNTVNPHSSRSKMYDPNGPRYKNNEYAEEDSEIDKNVDQISSGVSRIKMMATMMHTETEIQSERISRLAGKTEDTRERVRLNNLRVESM